MHRITHKLRPLHLLHDGAQVWYKRFSIPMSFADFAEGTYEFCVFCVFCVGDLWVLRILCILRKGLMSFEDFADFADFAYFAEETYEFCGFCGLKGGCRMQWADWKKSLMPSTLFSWTPPPHIFLQTPTHFIINFFFSNAGFTIFRFILCNPHSWKKNYLLLDTQESTCHLYNAYSNYSVLLQSGKVLNCFIKHIIWNCLWVLNKLEINFWYQSDDK